MSEFLEIPTWPLSLPFRTFENEGEVVVPPHWHKEIEIIYVVEGTVTIGYRQKLFQVHEGEIFVFASGETHYFLASPHSKRRVFQFDLSLFRNGMIQHLEMHELPQQFQQAHFHSVMWPSQTQEIMRATLDQLFIEMMQCPIGYEYAITSLLLKIAVLYYREIPKINEKNQDSFVEATVNQEALERLNEVFIYIETQFDTPITLDEVANVVGFSPYYFARFFKKHTGQTFVQFLTAYRINQAKYILANEKCPMIEVAERAGFHSVKTFHHVFKEQVGISPLKFQKAIFGNKSH
ncbi:MULTISPECIES: AraC family transcriptional regulator [Enterococcus]|uniref:HTH araC/xylS-type domain-containing protein n=1 Tax=Enterococcus sulfureus ATCC 49903 TaxID=1140003 RepID=S0L0L8_9ENTE|nr:AraC family transcriptional regulator [Enterococcus sulfureus]EOT45873.1 hypothetical protein OMY_01894 [Enterococcus sulfureus ATCC 49903]EOT83076.1 hypothetical protein I573_02189 [Enterococcus sulfureus ATCC 49903]